MDGLKQRLTDLISRYKYVLVIVLAGIFLMLLPTGESKPQPTVAQVDTAIPGISEQLEQILSQIQGVGRVRVMLTVARGEQTIYASDQDSSRSSENQSLRTETVLITNEDRSQTGLAIQVLPPVYQGAIVVCQGGGNPQVALHVVEAVCDATGLTADKITVLKMK